VTELWTFSATVDPPAPLLAEIAASAPQNVAYTVPYARAHSDLGARVCALLVRSEPRVAGCLGFLTSGRILRTLEIPSVPTLELSAELPFWEGVRAFSRTQRISRIFLNSFGSNSSKLRAVGTVVRQWDRLEYVIDLQTETDSRRFSSNHERNVNRARKLGVVVQRCSDPDLAKSHVTMMQASTQRRARRGENVPRDYNVALVEAYLRRGAGELYQAYDGAELRSSLLLLRAKSGAYYQSAGTSAVGMKQGASYLLVAEIIRTLRSEGLLLFNLGGASPDSAGLQRFKEGFRARSIRLQAMQCDTRHPVLRKLHTAARLIRDNPRKLLKALLGTEHFIVYSAQPAQISAESVHVQNAEVRRLSDDDLCSLYEDNDMKEQAERFARLGYNSAFGVFVDGTLAHVAWLITEEHDRKTRIRNVRLRSGEAEITHCLSRPESRGQGLYPLAIRALCKIATERGIREVFMITGINNLASRRGIEKAGFRSKGSILRFSIGPHDMQVTLTYRGHRLIEVRRTLTNLMERVR
jgi:RimJ/RimL family protein N-acetyltransferase